MSDAKIAPDDWGDPVALESRALVFPQRRLEAHDSAGGTAYAGRMRADSTQELVVIACDKGYFPRIDMINIMKMVDSPSVLKLREAGVVALSGAAPYLYALAFDRPMSDRYWKSLDETHAVLSEDSINHHFVFPLIKVMEDFQRMGIGHGAIRPTNIFWRDGSTTPPQLGECLSAPCGVGQPALFETVERAMCPPIGRGPALHADDCYALGVTLSFLMLGANPVSGLDDRAILQLKMEKGTFNALLANKKLAPSHVELLRGLLADDPRQRWTAEEMDHWVAGRRLTPKSSDAGRRASRFFTVAGKDYWQIRPLVAALAEDTVEAVKLIENGSLEKWVTRSLGDEERAKEMAEAIEALKEGSNNLHYQEQLVTRVCIALDPASPIRYRGLSVMPAGIGGMLADVAARGQNVQIISEIITAQFSTLWVNVQKDMKVDLVPLAQGLERMKSVIERTNFGNGIERVLYELNGGLPCMSPLVKDAYVLSPKNLLAALEHAAAHGDRAGEPMDRHIAAFLIARDKRSETLFTPMGPAERPLRRALAVLSLYADMQFRYGPDRVPKLSAWFLALVGPAAKRFLSRPLREKVRVAAAHAAEAGDLAALQKQVDDPRRLVNDEQDFLDARLLYQNIRVEMGAIESDLQNRETVARDIGRPVAATVASVLALILISLTLGRTLIHAMTG